jgi:hypothetical protein
MNFSLRKDTQPAPPSPAFTYSVTSSMNCMVSHGLAMIGYRPKAGFACLPKKRASTIANFIPSGNKKSRRRFRHLYSPDFPEK